MKINNIKNNDIHSIAWIFKIYLLRQMKMHVIFGVFLFFYTPSVFCQKWTLFKKNDSLDCQRFTTDPLFNIYVITPRNEVLKYDPQGNFDSRYANKKLGRLALIDATNAFKLVFWFPDFQTIQLMDALVNPIITLNLTDLGVSQAAAVAMSDDGFLWILDGGTHQMLKFSLESGGVKMVQKSPLTIPNAPTTDMIVRQNNIYINLPSTGIYVLDRFGKMIKTLDIKNSNNVQVIDNHVFYKQNNQLYSFHLQTLATTIIKLPEGVKGEQPMRLQRNRLFVQRTVSVDIYEEK